MSRKRAASTGPAANSARVAVLRDPVALGRAVRDARRGRGWTQAQLAEHVGVGQPAISNFERGRGQTVDVLFRALSALGLDLTIAPRVAADAGALWDEA